MKKKITSIFCLLLMISMQAQAQSFESAEDAVKNMGVGWNLGNTLEANVQTVTDVNDAAYWGQQGVESETCWGQPKTTREFIKMLKDAGFRAIRVPVTWYNHMDKDSYKIDSVWMARVKEVVDYVIDEGLYCIINVHHDTGADSYDANGKLTGYHWLKADMNNYNDNGLRFAAVWAQICKQFQDYGQKLLFEGFNEMLDAKSCWNYPTWSATGAYNEQSAIDSYEAIKYYNRLFVTTVRAMDGNNPKRNLIINTYAASCGGVWGNNTHPLEPLETMELTENSKHIIFGVHSYPNIQNGLANAKKGVDETIESLNTILKAKGAPVIFSEWGTSNVDNGSDYIDRRKSMIEFCDYFVKKCKENDIATFYWMGLSDGNARKDLVFNQPDLAEAITKAYHGENFPGVYPAAEVSDETVIFEGENQLEWGQSINIQANLFTNLSNTSFVMITYVQNYADFDEDNQYGMMQFWYGDWSEKIKFVVEGKDYDADFTPADVYGTESGTEHTTVFSFDAETFNTFMKKGMLFQGHGILVKKVVLVAGEQEPWVEPQNDENVYWEGDAMLDWGDGLQLIIPSEEFTRYGKDVKLTLYYTLDFTDYNMIQLFYGDWSSNPSFIINGQEIEKEFKPSDIHGLQNGYVGASELMFSEEVYNQIAEKGIALQGHGIRLNQVVLEASVSTGIQSIIRADDSNAPIYNLSGQRVLSPRKGIYIKNGRKYIVR